MDGSCGEMQTATLGSNNRPLDSGATALATLVGEKEREFSQAMALAVAREHRLLEKKERAGREIKTKKDNLAMLTNLVKQKQEVVNNLTRRRRQHPLPQSYSPHQLQVLSNPAVFRSRRPEGEGSTGGEVNLMRQEMAAMRQSLVVEQTKRHSAEEQLRKQPHLGEQLRSQPHLGKQPHLGAQLRPQPSSPRIPHLSSSPFPHSTSTPKHATAQFGRPSNREQARIPDSTDPRKVFFTSPLRLCAQNTPSAPKKYENTASEGFCSNFQQSFAAHAQRKDKLVGIVKSQRATVKSQVVGVKSQSVSSSSLFPPTPNKTSEDFKRPSTPKEDGKTVRFRVVDSMSRLSMPPYSFNIRQHMGNGGHLGHRKVIGILKKKVLSGSM